MRGATMTKVQAKRPHFRLSGTEKVAAIRQILFPGGDMDGEWDIEYLEDIARVVLDYDSPHRLDELAVATKARSTR
jgi:hypothetical protein